MLVARLQSVAVAVVGNVVVVDFVDGGKVDERFVAVELAAGAENVDEFADCDCVVEAER